MIEIATTNSLNWIDIITIQKFSSTPIGVLFMKVNQTMMRGIIVS